MATRIRLKKPTGILSALAKTAEAGINITPDLIAETLVAKPKTRPAAAFKQAATIFQPRNEKQAVLQQEILAHDLTFAFGPAGTGKTFVPVAMAITALNSGQIKKIVLARPAKEAGEELGFLKGTLEEKIAPYMGPFFRCL